MRGFTLVELLVVMVVLSVGLLGSMMLLAGSLRDHGLALRQQLATLLVQDVADRIRANGARVSDADEAAFAEAARALLPFQSPETSILVVPATGPAHPAAHHVTLRWREAGEDGASIELIVPVVAHAPVAG